MRNIFVPDGQEVVGEWKIIHSKELYDLYFSPHNIRVKKSKRVRWAGHVARIMERRGAERDLVGKPERGRTLGRTRRRWENDTKTDLQGVGWRERGLDLSGLGFGQVAALHLRVPYNAGNSLTSRETVTFSGRTLFWCRRWGRILMVDVNMWSVLHFGSHVNIKIYFVPHSNMQ